VDGAEVSFEDLSGDEVASGDTDASGNATVEGLKPGMYKLDAFAVVEARTNGLPVESFDPPYPPQAKTFTVTMPGEDIGGIKILTRTGESIDGTVTSDRDGKPVRTTSR
jgi:hypothetical protein